MTFRSTPLIGRQRELALIDEVLASGLEGAASLLVIRGEAGIGKSRLAQEMAARAEVQGYCVAEGRCWPLGGAPPLWPWHEVLDALAGPSAADLLDECGGTTSVDPERFARFRAVAALLSACAEHAPVLIVLDDLHGADAGAVLLVRFLARSPRLRRVVLAVTHREVPSETDPVAAALRELERDGAVLRLSGLSNVETSALATRHGRCLEADEVAMVRHVTGGNPLLVEALVAAASGGPLDADTVAVRRTLGARLGAVSPSSREVLRAAAVLGAPASVDDLAAVCALPAAAVRAARREVAGTGLLDPAADSIRFAHDLFRQAITDELDDAELLAWQSRATAALSPADGDGGAADIPRLVRWAHHALAASSSGAAAASTAIDACRRAARAMMHGFAYEAAADLLRAGVEVAQSSGSAATDAPLFCDLAQATLASGRLADARPCFRRAAEAAERTGDAALLAEATLGLGGIWVLEHRQIDDQAGYHALLARAVVALGDTRGDLAARLRMRLAAERAYLGEAGIAEVEQAAAEVRATGDRLGLAEALSLEHHVKLGPAYAAERLDLADELIRTASAAGDGVLTLMGLLWRTVDLYLAGRPDAERSLVQLRERADALGVESVRLVVRNIEVMQLLRAGRLDDAEWAAGECLEAGTRIGDADATAWYGGQLLARHWFEGRSAELLTLAEQMASSPTLVMSNQVFTAAWALLAAEAGQRDQARVALERLRADGGLAGVVQSSAFLLTLFCAVEAAVVLGDEEVAAEAYAILAPYAALPMVGSLAVLCLGSVERSLGRAALTTGDRDAGIGHLERAVEASRRLGNRPMHAITQADLADALAARNGPGDRDQATALLANAIAAAALLGMDRRATIWRDHRRALDDAPLTNVGRFTRTGDHWEVTTARERAVVPDSLGMQYLVHLLGESGRSVPVGELAGRDAGESHHEVLDEPAKNAYRRRIAELETSIDDADADADLERAARHRLELDALMEELGRLVRPGGRSRAFAGSRERARTSVQKAIRRAIDRLEVDAPELAGGLRRAIQTGTQCRYQPDEDLPPTWIVS